MIFSTPHFHFHVKKRFSYLLRYVYTRRYDELRCFLSVDPPWVHNSVQSRVCVKRDQGFRGSYRTYQNIDETDFLV